MGNVGLYKQLTSWTSEGAGTAEWCKAEKDGRQYFIKKFLSPVYPSKDLGLPEKKYQARIDKFHNAEKARKSMYNALRENDTSGVLVIPEEVMNFQYHICTVAPFVVGNVEPNKICMLSEWQRLVLMRTLTLALMNVHRAGVVHCDMKPENVMVYQNPENGSCVLKLIDFDSSFMEQNPPDDIAGDPAFFAPEAYAMASTPGIKLDQQIDIFALGIIFHYFWTGRLPEKDADQTLGQYVLKDKEPSLDPSVPGSLRYIIKQTLVKEPDKRIRDEEIYKGLGEILNTFPVKIINLQEKKKEPPNSPPDPVSHVLSVPVICSDIAGKNIESYNVEVEYGKYKTVYAKRIPGYHLASDPSMVSVSVDSEGKTEDSPVCFVYKKDSPEPEKKHGFRNFMITVIVLGLFYCLIMYILADTAISNGDYAQAKQYMDLFPLYSDIFPDKYNQTLWYIEETSRESRYNDAMSYYQSGDYTTAYSIFESLDKSYKQTETYMGYCQNHIKEEQYNNAVWYYQNGDYEQAYSIFENFETSYKQTSLYISFCQVHLWMTDDYSQVIDHLTFEDAKNIVAGNTECWCQYMLGSWTIRSSNGTDTVTLEKNSDGSYGIGGLPEMERWFWIADGMMYVQKEDESEGTERFLITIVSKSSMELYSYMSGITYKLTKK